MQMTNIPPIRVSGSLGNTVQTTDTGSQSRSFSNRAGGSVRASSYIWQPWFTTVDGSLNLTQEVSSGGTSDRDSILVGGDLTLNVLPLSRYPGSISVSRTDSRVDGGVGSDFARNRATVSSRALITDDLRTFATATYQNIDQFEQGEEDLRSVALSVSKTFQKASLSVSVEHRDSSFQSDIQEDETDSTDQIIVRSTYQPFDDVNVQSTTSVFYTQEDDETETRDRFSWQGVSTAQWRPTELPFTVNGALRTFSDTIKFGGRSSNRPDTESFLANGILGLNYPIMPRLTANAGLSATVQSADRGAGGDAGDSSQADGSSVDGTATAGISYFSLPEPVGGFDWNWNARANGELTLESDSGSDGGGLSPGGSVSVGHTGVRELQVPLVGPTRFSASQTATLTQTQDGETIPSVSHRADLVRNFHEEGVNTFVRFGLNDTRELAGEESLEFTLLQAQLNRQSTIDFRSQWRGSISAQVSRRKLGDNAADIVASANGRIGYFSNDLFEVRDLDFISELELNAIGLEDLVEDEDEDGRLKDDLRAEWSNRIEYRLGLLTFSLEGNLFLFGSELGNSAFFRVRRHFSGTF